MQEITYRYPGVRPFSREQRDLFKGRDDDTRRLFALILQEKLSVLFGKSGYGKSSLLNAGVLPLLEAETDKGKRHYVPVPIRFNTAANDTDTLLDKFGFHLRMALNEAAIPHSMHDIPGLPQSLWGVFKTWHPAPNTVFVLLFDQFEEFFSYRFEQQQAFKEHLAELLYTDYPIFLEENEENLTPAQAAFLAEKIEVRAVFSIRSDRLSELDRLKDKLPAILQKRFELSALTREQAREAIVAPAAQPRMENGPPFESAPFHYHDGALEKILRELAGSDAAQARIEAFQLQIVCSTIEKKVIDGRLHTVHADDLPDFKNVYEEYYENRLAELDPQGRQAARRVLEYGLLLVDPATGDARRLSRDAGELALTLGVPHTLLTDLERTYLLRREANSLGGYNYEISHDTLIAPVLKARREREAEEAERRKELERLETEKRALEAERKVAEERLRAEEAERLRQLAEAEKRKAQKMTYFSIALAALASVASLGAGYLYDRAENSKTEAKVNEQKALESEKIAEERRLMAEKALLQYRQAEAQNMIEAAKTYLNAGFIQNAKAILIKSAQVDTSSQTTQQVERLIKDLE